MRYTLGTLFDFLHAPSRGSFLAKGQLNPKVSDLCQSTLSHTHTTSPRPSPYLMLWCSLLHTLVVHAAASPSRDRLLLQ